MESPTKKKKSEHSNNTEEFLTNPFSPFPMSPFGLQSSTPITALINDVGITPFLGMTPSINDSQVVPSSRDWTPTMRERVPDGFDLQHAMSPPLNNKQKGRGKRNSAGSANALGSPLFPDLQEGDGLFDSEAQSHLNKNRQALANRIKATEKPSLPHANKKTNGNHPRAIISLGDMQAISNSSLLGEEDPSRSTHSYKYGIAEQFSIPDSLSQNSDHSGLAAITAAAETVQRLNPLPENTTATSSSNVPSPIVKTAISHPKKQRLKTKDDTDSAPSSPFKPFPLSQSSLAAAPPSYASSAIPSQLNAAIAPFSRNNSLNTSTMTPYRVTSVGTVEDKNHFEEMLRAGIQRAQQQRADDSKTVTCNCKKSKCLKMYCDCFRLMEYCKKTCNCYECNNLEHFEEQRRQAIRNITDRNPEAFKPRVTEDGQSNSKGHLTGCHCRKSACLKKYCECFTGNVPCTSRCRCIECKNVAELYTVDETIRKQAYNLTSSAQRLSNNNNNNSGGYSGPTPRTASSSSARSEVFMALHGKKSGAGGDGSGHLPSTRLNFSESSSMKPHYSSHPAQNHHHNNNSNSNSGRHQVVESDHSNLTTSTLYSTDAEEGMLISSRKAEEAEKKLSIDLSYLNNSNNNSEGTYQAMTSPELRDIALRSMADFRQHTVDSVESTSTYYTQRSERVYSAPSSPLRSAATATAGKNDALLSPIKLLELADVCSERQSQEEEEMKLSQRTESKSSSQSSSLTSKEIIKNKKKGSNNNNTANSDNSNTE